MPFQLSSDYSPEGDSNVWCLMTFTIGDYVTALGPNPSKEAVTELVTKNLCFLFDDTRALVDGGLFVSLELYTWNEHTPFSGGGPNSVASTPMRNITASNDGTWLKYSATAPRHMRNTSMSRV